MTSRDCFYCGKRVAAGKSCSVLFLDGRGYPLGIPRATPRSSSTRNSAIQPANMMQAMQHFRDCVQLISVLSLVQRRQQFRREQRARHTHYWGSLFLHTTILPAHRKVLTRCSPPQRWHLKPQGNRKVTLTHKSALEPAELHSLGAQRRSNHRMRSIHLLHHRVHGLRHPIRLMLMSRS